MYDYIQVLQGVVVPRCYGYFRIPIDNTQYTVRPWNRGCTYPRTEADFDWFDMPREDTPLNVLLLEQVGTWVPPRMFSEEIFA